MDEKLVIAVVYVLACVAITVARPEYAFTFQALISRRDIPQRLSEIKYMFKGSTKFIF